jgi:hypothetical protein
MAKLYKLVLMLTFLLQVLGIQSAWAQWVQDGVAVCAASGGQYTPQLVSDGSGGAIITWTDYRSNMDIYAQRIAPNGSVMWAVDGVAICIASLYQDSPQLVSDGSGGAIITWMDMRSFTYKVYAQRVAPNGSVMWTVNGAAICMSSGSQYGPQLVSDGSGGAIIAWFEYRSGSDDIFAQRVDSNGSVLWPAGGVAICAASGDQNIPRLVPDGSGGAVIMWVDRRSGSAEVYLQRVASNGSVLWTADGVSIGTGSTYFENLQVISDGSGGAIISWDDYRNGNYDVFSQRVNANGEAVWQANGVAISTANSHQVYPQLASDGSTGAIIAWHDYRSGKHSDVYAQRVDANGLCVWTADGVPVCTADSSEYSPQLTSDGSGGAVITWRDFRNGNYDLYAQKVDANGLCVWTANGIPVCTSGGEQKAQQLIPDGSGGAVIAWEDYRNGSSNIDVYAQRVDAAGHTVVATLLQNYAATFSESGIALTWTLSEVDEGVEFSCWRSTASNGPFTELPSSVLTRDGLSFSFIDRDWEPNTSYWYRVEYSIGSERKILFESGPVTTPAMPLTLYQNSPNPFNPSTEIRYYLPEKCSVVLGIYDVNGALVVRLTEGYQSQGGNIVSWDGRDRSGRQASSGVYFYRLKAGKTEISKKMVLTR